MKIFQIVHQYKAFIPIFESRYNVNDCSFEETIEHLIEEGFMACHLLEPIFNKSKDAFYTIYDYKKLQLKWAKENNINSDDLKQILIAQLEQAKPDVIYNMSPQRVGFDVFNALTFKPKIVCWNADAGSIDKLKFENYDGLLTSSVNKIKSNSKAHLFFPSQDPLMNKVDEVEKDIDIFFYGQYAKKLFVERNEALEMLTRFCLENNLKFKFALTIHPWTEPLINKMMLWRIPFLKKQFPSKLLSKHSDKPIYGIDIYKNIKRSKIVFNMSGGLKEFGQYKFNMRIFETLGNGGFMLSDKGEYPPYFVDGEHFVSYSNLKDLQDKILYYLKNDIERSKIAKNGKALIEDYYSKSKQYQTFIKIIEAIN